MDKPIISPNFTIEDIHTIREYNYEITKGMTMEQKIEYYNTAGTEAELEIQRRKATKRKMIINA